MSSSFGYAVADGCPDTGTDEGAMELAAQVALGAQPEAHRAKCPACKLLADGVSCAGAVATPLTQEVEEWLIERLPDEIESVAGFLLKKALADYGYEGAGGRDLRGRKLLASPGPYTKHYGPFFRRFTVSTDQLLEELFCAGDIQPAHALTLLVHLGALLVDGKVLTQMDEAQKLTEIIEAPAVRRQRTECLVVMEESDSPGVAAIKRFVRALWAAFVLDAELRVFEPAE